MTSVAEIGRRLIADYKFKQNGDWLQQGKCPACGKSEAFTRADQPYVIFCSRQNKCGQASKVRDLYPDLFGQYNQKYKATRAKPTATADAYMSIERGFDTQKIEGCYTQGKFKHPHGNLETATVRFAITDGVYMERFVEAVEITDPETGEKTSRKQNFKGKWSGLVWEPPGQMIEDKDEVWIVEGVIDALSLMMAGKKVMASLSAQHYPEKALGFLKNRDISLVWALDNDSAGKKWMQRHATRSRKDGFDTIAAYIPAKTTAKDWNDLYVREGITEEMIKKCRHHGELLLARSPNEKAWLIFLDRGSRFFCLEYHNNTYGVTVTSTEEDGDKVNLSLIANFAIQFQYFKRNTITKESYYSAIIKTPQNPNGTRCDLTGKQISSAAEFKTAAVSSVKGAVFTGNACHLNWITLKHLPDIKSVETINYLGYVKQHGAYIFNNHAYKDGQFYALNAQDFFEIGHLNITSTHGTVAVQIGDREDYISTWIDDLWILYGEKAVVTLAFWIGTLFAEQIRENQESYPFLQLVGSPGSGKSTLISFLWRLIGRASFEGIDAEKATFSGIWRVLEQVSNLPIVFIEGDRDQQFTKNKKFDWSAAKPFYNGQGLATKGEKNMGNETKTGLFRGGLVAVQNEAISAEIAVQERFLMIDFLLTERTDETRAAAERLGKVSVKNLSWFLHHILVNEQKILDAYKNCFAAYEQKIIEMPDMQNWRIAKNHAQIMAMAQAIFDLIGLDENQQQQVRDFVKNMAIERQNSIGGDHPVVTDFWDIAEYLHQNAELGINHCKGQGVVGINLNEFVELAGLHRQQIPPLDVLRKHLKNGSKTRPLTHVSHNVDSAIIGRPIRCWKFLDLPEKPFGK